MIRENQIELIDHIADRFRALSDTSRLRILLILRERGEGGGGGCNVSALTHRLGIAQAAVSKHLAVLKAAGLVQTTREGNQTLCRIADESVFEMCSLVCDGLFRELQSRQSLLASFDSARE